MYTCMRQKQLLNQLLKDCNDYIYHMRLHMVSFHRRQNLHELNKVADKFHDWLSGLMDRHECIDGKVD